MGCFSFGDDRAPYRDPRRRSARAARTDHILAVIGQLRAPQTEAAEQRDILDLLEMLGILDAHDDGAFFLGLGAIKIRDAVDQREHMTIAPGKALPASEKGQRLLLRVRTT